MGGQRGRVGGGEQHLLFKAHTVEATVVTLKGGEEKSQRILITVHWKRLTADSEIRRLGTKTAQRDFLNQQMGGRRLFSHSLWRVFDGHGLTFQL